MRDSTGSTASFLDSASRGGGRHAGIKHYTQPLYLSTSLLYSALFSTKGSGGPVTGSK